MERRARADAVARAPARAQQHVQEAAHHEQRGDETEDGPRAHEQVPIDHALVAAARRARHDARLRGVATEGERRQRLRPEVDGEDLHGGERQRERAARRGEGEERQHLGRGVGEDVEDELADVRVDPAPLLDGSHDAREVVVGEDHRGALAGHVGAGAAHRDADVRAPERRGVVDAVTGHGDDVALGPQGVGDPQLGLGRGAREDQLLAGAQDAVELGLGHARRAPLR